VLEARGLGRDFRGFTAVREVDLRVHRGSVHALIGPNGAGKTTCFHLFTRMLDPTRGAILYRGQDIRALQPYQLAPLGLVRSFQISSVFGHLSALENVRLALLRASGMAMRFWLPGRSLRRFDEPARALLAEVDLADCADRPAALLPYGRKRALEIATTLAAAPQVLLLDEPTQGMGHEDVGRITELIGRVARGRTVLMVEHNMGVVAGLCDRITVLSRGSVIAEGDYATVSAHPDVREAYLGGGS
jgi:branched-chain amino acid transport system ATP-binding protein